MTQTWPDTVLVLGLLMFALLILGGTAATVLEFRKDRIDAQRDEELRQLVGRYEKLAENTLDAQQRMAADVSELRTRTASIEQILRTVE
ncbi:hypothetical protein [Micromonospora radicis]|uniref:Uncharacterized protein n=1 Tax=Micromonospora radicis TaxID=1894971 RepID=A0A418MYK5_9ACTN|nr:hypothetical protein [Micromonospora radicis]RIV40290.1 hypothetical protein D2L64_05450 [Micromonospora radicis]